jgi:hypothetical protein
MTDSGAETQTPRVRGAAEKTAGARAQDSGRNSGGAVIGRPVVGLVMMVMMVVRRGQGRSGEHQRAAEQEEELFHRFRMARTGVDCPSNCDEESGKAYNESVTVGTGSSGWGSR